METGIAPCFLADESNLMLNTMVAYMKQRNERQRRRR